MLISIVLFRFPLHYYARNKFNYIVLQNIITINQIIGLNYHHFKFTTNDTIKYGILDT
ncbi:unnamed protein product [Brugia timori]|uniref:Uncharacterized protein n=1 Tax=Brugia timori TaxID=42155 RepID=A0A0R3QAB9_9BILA|nr:unnamed protein product [Brugia timori]